jgi:uncharacterized protein (DUF2141 family)
VAATEGQTTSGIDFELHASASISGVVKHATGAPVEGATALAIYHLALPEGTRGWYDTDVTDASGNFELRGLSPGRYRVEVSDDRHPDYRYPDIIELSTGEAKSGFELVLGSEMGSISGTVRSASTTGAIQGADVTALRIGEDGFSFGDLAGWGRAETSEDGTYLIERLGPGDYEVMAEYIFGPLPHEPVAACESYGFVAASTRPIAVSSGVTTEGIDFDLASGGAICGKVYEASGEDPIEGIEIEIDPGRRTRITDASGTYCFCGLPPGEYIVYSIAEGYAQREISGVQVQSGTTTWAPELYLSAPGSISGTVIDVSTEEPLDGMMVAAHLVDGDWGRSLKVTKSDQSGAFELSGLATGDYQLELSSGLPPTHDIAPEMVISVTEGETLSGLVLYATPFQVFQVSGFVLTSSGEAISEGSVRAIGEDYGWVLYCRGNIQPDGSFTIDDLRPDTYKVMSKLDGYTPAWSEPFVIDPATGSVSGVVVVVSSVGGGLEVTLTDDDTGEAVCQAVVSCSTDGPGYEWSWGNVTPGKLVDGSGQAVFFHVPVGRWCVNAAAVGYEDNDCGALADITEGATTTLNLQMRKKQ